MDVAVLDKKTRQPIHGLRPEDFVIKVGGRERAIVAIAESAFENRPQSQSTAWHSDVTTNAPVRGRVFVIVMDDALAGRDEFYKQTGKKIGHRLVDALGPGDRASVIFAQFNQHAVDFTDDRAALHRAIDTYNPQRLDPRMAVEMSRNAVRQTRQFLDSMPEYRRAIVWVTLGNAMRLDGYARSIGGVPLYMFRVNGLRAPRGGGAADIVPDAIGDAMRVLADQTGGRVFLDTNAPADLVPAMLDELSSFYTLGFEGEDVKDGAWTTVSVRRSGAEVIPSAFDYHSPESKATKPNGRSASGTGDGSATNARRAPVGLLDALSGPLPMGDLPLTLSMVPVATTAKEAAVVLTLGFTPPPQASGGDAYELELRVFDGEGLKQVHQQNQTIHVPTLRSGEVLLRVPLRPGRYNMRLSFQHDATKTAGSVYAPSVVVPDFGKEPLALSGLLVGHQEGAPIGGRQAVSELLPFAPTAVRTFVMGDHVGAMVRVYQRADDKPVATTVDATIIDESGATVASAHEVLDAARFVQGASEYRFEVPLATLRPGSFLLRIAATAGKRQVERTMKFTVVAR